MDQLEFYNRLLFLQMNAAETTSAGLMGFAKFLAGGLIFFIPLLLAGLWLWGGDVRRQTALKAAVVTALSLGVNGIIGCVWFHPRPEALQLGHTYIPHALNASFPSDHATIFIAVGLALLSAQTRLFGIIVLVAGIGVGWARIFLGIHFPLDMLGAVIVAGAVYGGVSFFWGRCGERIATPLVSVYRIVLAPLIARGWIRR